MRNFFISYTAADLKWAEWVAWVLEEKGFTTVLQAWDFRPGSNFVLEMQSAASEAERTIMILSPSYLRSQYVKPEWSAAFTRDPEGKERKLLPVLVESCDPGGMLSSIIQIRIAGLSESEAQDVLLKGVQTSRAKPSVRPGFPGSGKKQVHMDFPGNEPNSPGKQHKASSGIIKVPPTEIDKRRFLKQAFEHIKTVFEANLQDAKTTKQHSGLDVEFDLKSSSEFIAEIFLQGVRKCICRISLGGGGFTDSICYAEGQAATNTSCNELLNLAKGDELLLEATVGMFSGEIGQEFDLKRLSLDDTADYLWQRFTVPLR